jgi:hypothetical protein
MNEISTDHAPADPPRPEFCDAHGARHPDDHPTEAGNPKGCGVPLPEGAFDGSWIENHPLEDGSDFYVRVHGRIVPGGWTCSGCGAKYRSELPASL